MTAQQDRHGITTLTDLGWWQSSARSASWLPVYVAILVLFVASRWIVSPGFASLNNFWTIMALGSFVAILGAGEGLVILIGGIDLSVPWVLTLAATLTTGWAQSDTRFWEVLPVILLIGIGIGVVNGLGVVFLGVSPVVVTIATNVVVNGIVLLDTSGRTVGAAPSVLNSAAHLSVLGVPILVIILLVFATMVGLLMSKTSYGRQVYALGSSRTVARLSGVNVPLIEVSVYAFSGGCAALAGILLTGYSGQSALSMGDSYLLPSIAAVVIGGASIVGGRGHYIGTLGGAIFLSLLETVILAINLTDAVRDILFGAAILAAVVIARERF